MNKLICFTCMVALSANLNATHNRAGEILYKRVAPFTSMNGTVTVAVYNYSITVIKYTDHGTTVADRCADTVYFGDGSKGLAVRVNGNLSCSCGTMSCGELISGAPGLTVKKNVYTIVHTYPGSGIYIAKINDPGRVPGIHNIPNSAQVGFILEAEINISNTSLSNSSPEFSVMPVDQATNGICYSHNPGAIDTDGDSLSFELMPCIGVAGYFYPEVPASGSFSLQPASGTLTWCNPVITTIYNVAMRISEWRKNNVGAYVRIGYTTREIQIVVKPGGPAGMSDVYEEGNYSLYPNPVTSALYIEGSKESSGSLGYTIFDVSGKEIRRSVGREVSRGLMILVIDLDAGYYSIVLETGTGVKRFRFVKA